MREELAPPLGRGLVQLALPRVVPAELALVLGRRHLSDCARLSGPRASPGPESSEITHPDGGFTHSGHWLEHVKPYGERWFSADSPTGEHMMTDSPVSNAVHGAGANEPQPRLLLRFALYAGAVLLGSRARDRLARQPARSPTAPSARSRTKARAIVSANLRFQLRPSDFTAPVSPARRATLDQLFRHGILTAGVVGGRLAEPEGHDHLLRPTTA